MVDPRRFNEMKDWMGRPFHPTIATYALMESIGKPKQKQRCKRKNKKANKR